MTYNTQRALELLRIGLESTNATPTNQTYRRDAYFSPSWTAFQVDGGRDFNVVVDGVSV